MVPCEESAWRRILRPVEETRADGVSLINTLNSITAVNLDTFSPEPSVDGKGSHGGNAGMA